MVAKARRNPPTMDLLVFREYALHSLSMDINPAMLCRRDGPETAAFAKACRADRHRHADGFLRDRQPCGRHGLRPVADPRAHRADQGAAGGVPRLGRQRLSPARGAPPQPRRPTRHRQARQGPLLLSAADTVPRAGRAADGARARATPPAGVRRRGAGDMGPARAGPLAPEDGRDRRAGGARRRRASLRGRCCATRRARACRAIAIRSARRCWCSRAPSATSAARTPPPAVCS